MEMQKVWLVTGASGGLGLALVKRLLNNGFRVAATSRNIDTLTNVVGIDTPNFLPLRVDLNSENSIREAVETTIATFGRINVIVNNAGCGLMGALEEVTDEEVKANFNINVFGSLSLIRQVLPHFRAQQSGHIINISSIGGFYSAFPNWGIYCATKAAIQGYTESLAAEIKPFGLHATVVSPGSFRTDFLTSDSTLVVKNQIAAYKEERDSQASHQIDDSQAGNPDMAAAAMIAITTVQNPPLHLMLGQDAHYLANQKIELIRQDMENWKDVTTAMQS
jgi:NAD(P)-dependent dehydrogenase (short-subunit alcohol dehydrogenase family)